MNADRLLAHYKRIADAPDAVPRLRRFVLDLAVRGKLVDQDPNDEPAAELLKRIAKEKTRLVKAGEIRKPRIIPTLLGQDVPFPLPTNWHWVTVQVTAALAAVKGPPVAADDIESRRSDRRAH